MSAPANLRRLPEEKAKDNWQTPPELFHAIEQLLGVTFELDVAASPENALCERFLTGPCLRSSGCPCGLCAPWDAVAFGNPPFSLNREFIAKACNEPIGPIRALLVPNATDGRWWQAAYESAQQKYHLLGRIPFIDPETGKRTPGNTTGSTLFAWGVSLPARECCWDWRRAIDRAAAQISKGAVPLPWGVP